ncbi:MAG: histidine phosphatase family protein [Actinobacteria bacterium]|nr:histidine phosphatase family protein [Actinomycetota bacterium]MCA1720595.1 histidine phosphatase family protein [Actinomycetota bacterium]
MPRLLLVRHATSVPPSPDWPDEYERPLSPLGEQQADELVGVLRAQFPDRVLSSPYRRAVQTVAPLARALGLRVETREVLREWRSGITGSPDWRATYRESWERPAWSALGGETQLALEHRAVGALRQLAAEEPPAAVTVVGSHGTWIARALHGIGFHVDADFWFSMPMPAVYEVDVDRHEMRASGPGLLNE